MKVKKRPIFHVESARTMSQRMRIAVITTTNMALAMIAVRTPIAYLFRTARRNAMFPPMKTTQMRHPRSVCRP